MLKFCANLKVNLIKEKQKIFSSIMFCATDRERYSRPNLVAGVPRRVLCLCSFVENGNFFFLKSFTKVTSCFIAARPVVGF
jgi:hypothetical protein